MSVLHVSTTVLRNQMKKKIKIEVKPIPDVRFSLIKEKKPVKESDRIFERDYVILAEMDRVHLQ